jgi:cyclic pyranopterin monophosphate synthase
MTELTHMDDHGRARMVDVGEKAATLRTASAEAVVRISGELEGRIRANDLAKGNLLEVARLAGIQLCHSLALDVVEVEAVLEPGAVRLRSHVRTHGKTGVEMEALMAVSIAALTVIDMGKALDRAMVIEGVRVLEKHWGRSGSYVAEGNRT